MSVALPFVRQTNIDARTAELALFAMQVFGLVLATVALLVFRVRAVRLAIAQKQKRNARAVTAVKVRARAFCNQKKK